MSRQISIAAATIFSVFFLASIAFGQEMVCWQLDHGRLGISPFVYKMSVQDLGNGNYLLVGSSYSTTVTDPPKTIRRVVRGGAVVMDKNNIEVSLDTSDISDRPDTKTVESLASSTTHLLLDSTLSGTFHTVNVHYPEASDTESSVTTSSFSGTVKLIDCE